MKTSKSKTTKRKPVTRIGSGTLVMPHVWIVEMWNPRRDKWEPTVGCTIQKDEAAALRRDWLRRNPNDKFRVQRYAT